MKKLFSFIFAACMAVTAFAAEESYLCPAGTLEDGKLTYETECCTIVHEQGESTTALKSVSPWKAPSKSIMTITPKPGVSIEKFVVNAKTTTLGTFLASKCTWTNAVKTASDNKLVTFSVTNGTEPVVCVFSYTTYDIVQIDFTYTGGATTEPEPEQPADTTVTPTPEPEPEPEPEPKPTGEIYTVAGSPAKLFGSEWNPANKANIMEFLADGTYKWEKKDVEMSATTVQFKVVKGSAWGTEYPSSNYNLKIAKSGKYTITITFNPNGNKVGATATLQQEVEVIPSIAIAGDMNGWNTSANTFTMAEDKKTASLALNLEAKDYGFKMIVGGSWTNDGQKITRENNSAVYTGANVDTNGTLTADVAGEYTFTWTYATSTLAVTYPAATPEQPGDTTVTPEPEPEPEPVAETWTVVGAAGLMGTGWDLNNKENDMALQADGTYKLVKENLTLAAGNYEYKAAKDRGWDVAVPQNGNQTLKIAKAGKYTVTFVLDIKASKLTATPTLQEEVEVIPTVAIAGDMNEWNETANLLVLAADKLTATATINLAEAKDYGFKVILGGNWLSDGGAVTREAATLVFTGANTEANTTLTADVAGEYTFTWTYATNTLVVTYPAKSTVGFENIEATENAVKFIENGKIFIIREGNIYDATGARVK
jgi:hypothetical protein